LPHARQGPSFYPMSFDSHRHLTAAQFAGEADAVLERARAAGVAAFCTIASDVADARAALELATRHADVWCSAGVHPHAAGAAAADALAQVESIAADRRCVAIGETGLDYHYDTSPRPVQLQLFEAQLSLAARLGLPAVVHSRSAEADTMAVMRASPPGLRAVLHCFTGSRALLDAALEAGWHVSFTGLVSFRNYDGADLVRAMPADRLMIETDSPYLAPVPHRGRRNEPAFLPDVAAAVARIRGESVEALAAATAATARAFYGTG
jgi:TatD DNase family protein